MVALMRLVCSRQCRTSDKFERDGSTIYYKLNLNFVQAALGGSVDVPTNSWGC